jgi:hypothetical protein
MVMLSAEQDLSSRITALRAELGKFDPEQPRDKDGKWASDGTDASGARHLHRVARVSTHSVKLGASAAAFYTAAQELSANFPNPLGMAVALHDTVDALGTLKDDIVALKDEVKLLSSETKPHRIAAVKRARAVVHARIQKVKNVLARARLLLQRHKIRQDSLKENVA